MILYENKNGTSGVESYEIGTTFIIVKFQGSARTYKYSYEKAGKPHVDNMKKLAQNGVGLNTYINQHVRKLYD